MSDYVPAKELPNNAAAGSRVALVTSTFNHELTEQLRRGAAAVVREHGAEEVLELSVPGAFELPMAAHRIDSGGAVDGVVCCGALIRGETPHFDVLAHSVAGAIQTAARETGVPIGFGVLTCDTLEQAQARCGGERGNKGADAALAVIHMIRLYATLRS